MEFYIRCLYAILLILLIIIVLIVIENDKQEELKYANGLPCGNSNGTSMLKVKARDGALTGFIMGTLTTGPVGGIINACKFAIVGPLVGGLSHINEVKKANR
jgi:hypothetical protein